ncbi:hypothetical protein [Methanococcus aeolicus]|uniref:hypothetical protein n=1 Tax=Methanococcus aeolicus TaxID=42879 RepID=UPI000322D043|nr:hypothetical protein [Methanococcus aeolicus]
MKIGAPALIAIFIYLTEYNIDETTHNKNIKVSKSFTIFLEENPTTGICGTMS